MQRKSYFRTVLCTLLCVVMLVSMAGCAAQSTTGGDPSSTTPGDSAQKRDTLTVVIAADPSNIDPNDSSSQKHHQVTRQIYETLIVYDNEGNLLPWLAESWEYEDDETIIFKIRKGVHFHNGDELKASDVLFTFKRIKEQGLIAMMEIAKIDIDKCEVIDDYTIKIVTDGPYAIQLPLLENPDCCIISERAYTEADGDLFNGGGVGTGPYTFVDYKAGDQITLKAFDNYWNTEAAPKIENIVMRFISDSSSRAIEAETGGADIVYDINAKDIDRLESNPNVKMISEMGTNTSYLNFNVKQAPLDNPLVREAIWYGVDVEPAVKIAYGTFGAVAKDFVSPGIGGASKNISQYYPKRDVEKAKALLAEAGYPNGLTLHISASSSSQDRCDLSEVFQAQLAEVGITLQIDVMESSAWSAQLLAGEAQLSIYGLSATTFEAGRPLTHFLLNNSEQAIWGWEDPEFLKILESSLVTIDQAKRYEMYAKCQEMLMSNFMALPIWHKELNAAVQSDVGGFSLTRSYEQHYLQYVYFE